MTVLNLERAELMYDHPVWNQNAMHFSHIYGDSEMIMKIKGKIITQRILYVN